MDARKSGFTQTHLICYESKTQDSRSVSPEMVTFKDPFTLDMGC